VDSEEPAAAVAAELFLELASETRFSILASLGRRPAKLSTLARELDITVQDVHRNLNRMMDAGLVRRDDGTFRPTEFGKAVTRKIPYFLFMKRHARFFEEHTLDGLPDKFVQRIGSLQGGEMVSRVTPVLERLKKLESSAVSRLKIMVSQAWVEEGVVLASKAAGGAEVLALVGYNTVFPREVIESIIPSIDKLLNSQLLKSRVIERVGTAVYISDDQAAVMFPTAARGEPGMGSMLLGKDSEFLEWCNDLFDYLWAQATPFDIHKAQTV
jgi:predicted transcriptional regulator